MTELHPPLLCQLEIECSDIKKSLEFYENVLGFRKSPCEIHEIAILEVGDATYGISLVPAKSKGSPSPSTIYFVVQDPDNAYEKVEVWGGKKILGPEKVTGYGVVFKFADPNGQKIGLFSRT